MSDESLVDRVKPLADAIQQHGGTLDSIFNDDDLWLTASSQSLLSTACNRLSAALECLNAILIINKALSDRYDAEIHEATSWSRTPEPTEAKHD